MDGYRRFPRSPPEAPFKLRGGSLGRAAIDCADAHEYALRIHPATVAWRRLDLLALSPSVRRVPARSEARRARRPLVGWCTFGVRWSDVIKVFESD